MRGANALRADELAAAERRHLLDRERLRKELGAQKAEARAELLRMTDEQVDATTKRTLVENGRLSSELARQSKAAEALVRENDELRPERVPPPWLRYQRQPEGGRRAFRLRQ